MTERSGWFSYRPGAERCSTPGTNEREIEREREKERERETETETETDRQTDREFERGREKSMLAWFMYMDFRFWSNQ